MKEQAFDVETFLEHFSRHMDQQDHILRVMEQQQKRAMDAIRYTFSAQLYNPASTTLLAPIFKTQSDVLVTTILASVPSGAGLVTFQLGSQVLGPLPNPTSGYFNFFGVRFHVGYRGILTMAFQNAAAGGYVGFFGSDLGTSGMIGGL